ncbi:NfeD family protein [Corynebacterium doosanense]|uniref:Membrane protein n=1 Tax=Corynebacterium doosanense CAU 212 = DSM 45436 TaxID=558173 RepID=A0A097IG39_9CORY|nr:NfeD family protein [Corynebacterium doosanense]AIT61105.1 membrane protein [Corynebacterium doosanense CAU 212 = DSM 45436]
MGALIWFITAVAFGLLELAAGEFTLLMLGGAALATAGVALADVPLWAELATFSAAAALLLLFLRPVLKRRLAKPLQADNHPRELVGTSAEVLEDIGAEGGQIRLDGSIWSARSLDPDVTFAEGERVRVADIDGPVAVVWKET